MVKNAAINLLTEMLDIEDMITDRFGINMFKSMSVHDNYGVLRYENRNYKFSISVYDNRIVLAVQVGVFEEELTYIRTALTYAALLNDIEVFALNKSFLAKVKALFKRRVNHVQENSNSIECDGYSCYTKEC